MKRNIAFLFLILVSVGLSGCRQPEIPTVRTGPGRPKQAEAPVSEPQQAEEEESLLKELLRKDPFNPGHGVTIAPKAGGSELKGIVWDEEGPYAIMGDNVIKEGDYLGEKKVLKIYKDYIVVDNKGREEIIRLE
ncbi:MAG: hypothetical protein AB1481_05665 [Candidatus Omnitrophota bacterium]